jgi:hypothetical protein
LGAAVATAAVATLLVVPVPGARAAGDAALSLDSITPWVAPGGEAVLRLTVHGPPRLEVSVTVHRLVATRSQLADTIDGKRLGRVEGLVTTPVDGVADENGHMSVTLPLQDPSQPRDPLRVAVTRTGVYPLEVELRDSESDRTVDSLTTHLVVLGGGVQPLTVAFVWRIDARLAHDANGAISADARRALAEGGRLTRIADALTAASDVPFTVAPTPETLEAWAELGRPAEPPAPLGELQTMARQPGRQMVTAPYAPIDVGTLESAGLGSEVAAQFARGADVLDSTLGTRPDPRTVITGSVDSVSLARLRDAGIDRLILDPSSVNIPTRLTPARPFSLESRGRRYTTGVLDPGLAQLLASRGPGQGVAAQRFLAALMLVALEAPAESRGVVVVTPAGWDPSAAAIGALLAGLRANPVVHPDTLDGYFSRVALDRQRRALAAPRPGGANRFALDPVAIRSRRHRIDAFAALVEGNDPAVLGAERALLLAESAASSAGAGPRRRARSYLGGVERAVRTVLGNVRGPGGRTVTLTARRANLPISLLNGNPRPLRVRVRLTSDKLLFPRGADRALTLAPHNTIERFMVETRTSGAFPLVITVTSPDGNLLVTRSELTIRSTVVSGVGVFLAAGAAAFLFGWWAVHLRRNRRSAVLVPDV